MSKAANFSKKVKILIFKLKKDYIPFIKNNATKCYSQLEEKKSILFNLKPITRDCKDFESQQLENFRP